MNFKVSSSSTLRLSSSELTRHLRVRIPNASLPNPSILSRKSLTAENQRNVREKKVLSKFHECVAATLSIGVLTTTIAQAQQILTLPLGSQPVPVATTMTTPTPMPEATTAATTRLIPRSQMAWHGGRGAEYFISGDYLFDTQNVNEFNPSGISGSGSFAGRVGASYPVGKLAVMAEGTWDQYEYTHPTGPVTVIGGNGQAIVPSFFIHSNDWDARLGVGLQQPRVFLVASYAQRLNNYGYPNLQGYGFGIEKLPDFNDKTVSFFGSYLWYPQFGAGQYLQYGFYKYQAGIEAHSNNRYNPLFVEVGYMGDYGYGRLSAPASISDHGVFAGLGLHF